MKLNRILNNLSDHFSNKIDYSIVNYIENHLRSDMNDLEKSIAIYLCLNKIKSISFSSAVRF